MKGGSATSRERTSSVRVSRGLFVLRYAEAASPDAPAVAFAPAPGHENLFEFLPFPDASINGFKRPGDFIALASHGEGDLQITVRSVRPGASLDARLELENLQRDAQASTGQRDVALLAAASASASSRRDEWSAAPVAAAASDPSGLDVTLIGHVARRGNVAATGGEWIAGPLSPAPIEGLVVQGSCAAWIEMQVTMAGEANWTSWQAASRFAGTQGQARPLTAVRLRLSAEAPVGVEIQASALFLGSPVQEQSGRSVELRSAAGRDPLVGFQLGLKQDRAAAPHVEASAASGPAKGRVRIFRAGVERLSA